MTEEEPDPIVTRSLTINELMDGDGTRRLSFDDEGGMEHWDIIGFLDSALMWFRSDLANVWREAADADDD